MSILIKSFDVPSNVRKKTNFGTTQFYEKLEIYDNKIVGFNNKTEVMSWFYKDYNNIQVINANLNSQFARIVFVTSATGNKQEVLLSKMTNASIQGDLNKILFCSGMFSYKTANEFAKHVYEVLYKAFIEYKEYIENMSENKVSTADEIKKYKDLLDCGAITEDEFSKKKKELLNL